MASIMSIPVAIAAVSKASRMPQRKAAASKAKMK